nr:sugar kinase [Cryobacterium roopkundense]
MGETMVSLRTDTPLRLGGFLTMTMAGAESNVAIGLARLGHSVRWAGRVGADEVGEFILRTLRAERVVVDTVATDSARSTGLMLAERRVSDISRVSYYRSGSAGSALTASDATAALTDAPRVLHLSGITPALSAGAADCVREAIRLARAAGSLISLDINYRSKLWTPGEAGPVLRALARQVDIVIASEDELALVGSGEEDHIRQELAAEGVAHLVIKRGARGATLWRHGIGYDAPALQIAVRDTIGAGDAFTAGFLSGVLDDLDPVSALRRGTVTAAFAVAAVGDWEGLPTRDELGLLDAESGTTVR